MKLAYAPEGDVTQYFAENPRLYAPMGMKGHNGVDLVRPHGEAMFAIEDGTVVEVKDEPGGYGRHLRFIGDAKDAKGYQNEWTYGHNFANYVKVGDKVKAGQLIALMGNTGFVVSGATPFWRRNPFAGTHLHLGLRKVRVVKRGGWSYPQSTIRLQVISYNNGYKGAIDPLPYLMQMEDLPEISVNKEIKMTIISLANQVINILTKK